MNLTAESYEKIVAANRLDLVLVLYINESGYAGCNSKGTIVDRRLYPDAVPVQANAMLGIPKPKPLP